MVVSKVDLKAVMKDVTKVVKLADWKVVLLVEMKVEAKAELKVV